MSKTILRAKKINKDFAGVQVLFDISISGERGQVHGLIGENGAGKSTLMKIIAGFLQPSSGRILIDNKPVNLKDPAMAKRMGITMIHQELNLVEDLKVYENIFLGKEIKQGMLLNKRNMIHRSKEILKELGEEEIDPLEDVRNLSVAKKQMVEIARAISENSRILIMDEPTSALTDYETEILFKLIKELKQKGVCIFYVSHRLKEVKEICDVVTVLRDGRVIGEYDVSNVSEVELANAMVGREIKNMYPQKPIPKDEVIIEVKNLNVPGLVKDVSFQLKKGEILGFAGLVGAGRTEMAEALVGLRKKASGEIFLNGEHVYINNYEDAKQLGISYLPEDRKQNGLVLDMNIVNNITLISLEKYMKLLIDKKKEMEKAKEYREKFDIRCRDLFQEVRYLSGGNQQKVVLSKCLEVEPQILILDEPTRGIDINTKYQIYQFIANFVKSEKSCIVISSELQEIIGLCNRVLVMREGKIVAELMGKEINEEEIILYATGIKEEVY
ncbi:MAG TPA: sugar ABC transporter ATP-binding protein [Thermotogaceae bacterium]|nr:sugar ABC transporter ATP-binding protein [Thermotogaceae bacterium]